MHPIREFLSWSILTVFIIFFFSSALRLKPSSILQVFDNTNLKGIDFSRYIALRTLTDQNFPLHGHDTRVIIVGDIHGMDKALQSLLEKLSYNPQSDKLIHCGDIIAKGSLSGSLSVLEYMTSNNITGVRGNHDQKVIEWRSWLNWIRRKAHGREWLLRVNQEWEEAEANGADLDLWIDMERRGHDSRWWKRVPKGWRLFGEHYKIAHAMTEEHYEYLLSLPLTLYAPSAHTYIAHAGLLPSDPHRDPSHPKQPLAHLPTLPPSYGNQHANWDKTTVLRQLQELALLGEVPQNRDPWVVLNMRGVLEDNSVTRKSFGTPWSEFWNADMSRCQGFEANAPTHNKGKNGPLPCLPSMIVYGHSASRGLDVKRWSVGLDTGCVYKRRLTALVLGSSSHHVEEDDLSRPSSTIPYGDNSSARIVSVKCHSD